MFRRLPHSLPKDPVFPSNLKDLGYFITDAGLIRKVDHPDDPFQFWITNNARYNDVQREAMHECIRAEIVTRLAGFNVVPFYLPQMTTTKPPAHMAHVPILATDPQLLPNKKHIVVVFNRAREDLGVWSYRDITKGGGIDAGSAVSLVAQVSARAAAQREETPGFIVLNIGQRLYSYKQGRALTMTSWDALPRPSAVHPPPSVDRRWNHVPHSRTEAEHVDFVFRSVVYNSELVRADAGLYLVGLESGGDVLVEYLRDRPEIFPRIKALALTAPLPAESLAASLDAASPLAGPLLRLLRRRARAWTTSHHALNTPLAKPPLHYEPFATTAAATADEGQGQGSGQGQGQRSTTPQELFPTLSGGTAYFGECVMSAATGAVLDWFEAVLRVEAAGRKYCNAEVDVPEFVVGESEGEQLAGHGDGDEGW